MGGWCKQTVCDSLSAHGRLDPPRCRRWPLGSTFRLRQQQQLRSKVVHWQPWHMQARAGRWTSSKLRFVPWDGFERPQMNHRHKPDHLQTHRSHVVPYTTPAGEHRHTSTYSPGRLAPPRSVTPLSSLITRNARAPTSTRSTYFWVIEPVRFRVLGGTKYQMPALCQLR